MGGETNQSTTTTGSSSQAVTDTTNKLLGGLSRAYDGGTAVFDKSLYPGVGDTTKNAWTSMLGAANNPAYSGAVNGAIGNFGDAAAGGQNSANDPYYRQLGDDTLRDVNAQFTSSGRFGSGSHVESAVKALGDVNNANVASDRAWQAQSAGMLPSLFSASMAPSAALGSVGAAQDADALAQRQGDNDLFRRKSDSLWDTLGRSSSILGGTSGSAGTTSTTSQPATPWWQQLLGAGAIGSGIYANVFK